MGALPKDLGKNCTGRAWRNGKVGLPWQSEFTLGQDGSALLS